MKSGSQPFLRKNRKCKYGTKSLHISQKVDDFVFIIPFLYNFKTLIQQKQFGNMFFSFKTIQRNNKHIHDVLEARRARIFMGGTYGKENFLSLYRILSHAFSLSLSLSQSIYLSIYPTINLSIYPTINLSPCLIYLSIHVYLIYLSFCSLYIFLSIYININLSLSIFVSLSI